MNLAINAIADPTRREIMGLLREGPRSAGAVAAQFEVSRPAVSRHLRVLREAGLVHSERAGRVRRYQLDPEPLKEVTDWIDELSRPGSWEHRMNALDTEIRRTVRERRQKARKEEAA